jgi:predicted DNA-binding antitoxin AbrB/MazE fold protein
MSTIIRARYSNGKLEPLETLKLEEGQEVSISIGSDPVILREATDHSTDFLEKSFGGWVGIIDCEELKRSIYEAREKGSRHSFEP